MGPRVILALIVAAALFGCNKAEENTATPGSSPVAADNGKGMKPQAAPELMPPPDAPKAEDVVGSKAGGGK